MSDADTQQEALLKLFKFDRFAAHQYLFPHRHKDISPEFHRDLIALFNDPHQLVAVQAFRGGAKTTNIEEYIIVQALFREVNYVLVVGNNWSNACDRIAAIQQELTNNDSITELFGNQVGSTWSQDEIVLANGVKIKALGARQSVRGLKHNNERPDLAVIDDLEDEENITTEEARRKTERWLVSALRPALNPKTGRIRFIGTAIHPKALIEKVFTNPNWKTRKFPIFYIDEMGEEVSAWPDRFSMEKIIEIRSEYMMAGNMIEFEQEYMCRSEDVAGKPFQASMIKVAPAPAHYMPITIAIDPARTVNQRSARTGYVAGSWFGSKLYVHEAMGCFHKPDELIRTIFEWNDKFKPVSIGVETNSLEEFIKQPLQLQSVAKGISLPIEELRAPRDKLDFIKGLQIFYNSGSVIHTKHLPDLEAELLQFPTGRMDVPNALAYFLKMRAGRPVYEDFTHDHIAPVLEMTYTSPKWLVVSARPSLTTAALLQYINGTIKIYHDWVQNRPAQEALPDILREAIMLAGGQVKVATPYEQYDKYNNSGIPAAAKRLGIQVTRVTVAAKSEGILKEWLTKRAHGEPILLVADEARWTINALARGYARKLERDGGLAQLPTDNQYKVLMEAIESFMDWFNQASKYIDNELQVRYAYTQSGQRYITSLPG
jgi:hypothetical protein